MMAACVRRLPTIKPGLRPNPRQKKSQVADGNLGFKNA